MSILKIDKKLFIGDSQRSEDIIGIGGLEVRHSTCADLTDTDNSELRK